MIRVKVCGLTNIADADSAAAAGADVLGFVREPGSRRFFSETDGLDALRSGWPWMPLCAVFGTIAPDPMLDRFDIVQSEDGIAAKGKRHISVLRVTNEETVGDLLERAHGKKFVVLDPYHPTLAGGTGQTLDWGLAAEFVQAFDGKVVLAGGLDPDNVAEAVRRVKPYGVDASSGLEETLGKKSAEKVRRFVEEARSAD